MTDISSDAPIDPDLVDALAHPLRVAILLVLFGEVASPKEISERLHVPLGDVSYHVKRLLNRGSIKFKSGRQVRGAYEHFYAADPRSFVGHRDWRRVPRQLLTAVSESAVKTFMDQVAAAHDAGTLANANTTLTWLPLVVDEKGRRESSEILAEAEARLLDVHEQSHKRLQGERSGAINLIAGLAAFDAGRGDAI